MRLLAVSVVVLASLAHLSSGTVLRCPTPKVEFGSFKRDDIPGKMFRWHSVGSIIRLQCIPGYNVEGNEFATCLEGGVWSADIGSCVPPTNSLRSAASRVDETKHCVMPDFEGFDDNLVVDLPEWPKAGTKFAPGTVLNFFCNGELSLIGSEMLTCLGPDWDTEDLPFCQEQEPYNIVIKSTIGDCSLPDIPDLVQLDSKPLPKKLTSGEVISLKCATGTLSGSRRVRCVRGGIIAPSLPSCTKCKCSAPCQVPAGLTNLLQANGNALPTNASCDQTLFFKCDGGLKRQGPSSVTCSALARDPLQPGFSTCGWNAAFPTCKACPDCIAPAGLSARLHLFDKSPIPASTQCNKQIFLSCDASYQLIGSSVVKCAETANGGSWDSAFPTCCTPCTMPALGANVKIIGGSRTTGYQCGEVAEFYCDGDFKMKGFSSMTCVGPDWSNDMPSCYKCDSCSIPWTSILAASPNISVTTDDGRTLTNADDQVECNCKLNFGCPCGYKLSTPDACTQCMPGNATANTTSHWDDAFPTCTACQCKKPPPPRMDRALIFDPRQDLYDVGSVINFNCTQGDMDGPTTATCQIDSSCCECRWSEYPTCGPSTPCECPPLRFPTDGPTLDDTSKCTDEGNGFMSCTGYKCGSSPTFKCKDGYTKCQSATMMCRSDSFSNGIWDGTAPMCKPNCGNCTVPANMDANLVQQGGMAIPDSYPAGQTIFFACKAGYTLQGSMQLKCNGDPCRDNCAWGTFPTCVMGVDHCSKNQTCSKPPCECSFNLRGTDGEPQTTPGDPHCRQDLLTGRTVCTFQCGESAYLRCPNDQCPPTSQMVCVTHNRWSSSANLSNTCSPRCSGCNLPADIDGNLREMLSGGALAANYTRGQTVFFACANATYRLEGSRQATCSDTKVCSADDCSWSNPFPWCIPPPAQEVCTKTSDCSCSVPAVIDRRLSLLHLRSENDRSTDLTMPDNRGLFPGQVFECGQDICLECPDGYMLRDGDPSWLKCQQGCMWDHDFPQCIPAPTCRNCPVPGIFQFQNLKLQPAPTFAWPPVSFPCGTYNFVCDPGFNLQGTSVVSCYDGIFSANLPSCVSCLPCPKPAGADAALTPQLDSYPCGVVTFSCSNNARLRGKWQIYCNNGVWSDPFPTCPAPPCALPPAYKLRGIEIEGNQKGDLVEAGTRLKFRCSNRDSSIVGSPTVRCVGPHWRNEFPTCTEKVRHIVVPRVLETAEAPVAKQTVVEVPAKVAADISAN